MINRKRGLGRGLDSLIPLPGDRSSAVPTLVGIDEIRVSDQQLRRSFAPEPLRELAESIRRHGLLQPVLVRPLADGYQLIAGERRWRAARLAGLERIPALVRDADAEEERLLLGLVENLQREDLNPLEEAQGIRRLVERHGLTHEEVAARLGRNRVSVTQSLRLLSAAPAVQSAAAGGLISSGHARALAGLPETAQELGLKVVVGRRLSVRQTEAWVKRYAPPRRLKLVPPKPSPLEGLAEDLSQALELPVRVVGSGRRGRVVIGYSSAAELQRVRDRLLQR
jgi:ParB family transcriptional regulator, chromosome partitioning protein